MFFWTHIDDHPPNILRILSFFFEIFCGLGLQGETISRLRREHPSCDVIFFGQKLSRER